MYGPTAVCRKKNEPNLFTIFNPFPNKPCFLHACSTSLLKTLLEKEKCLQYKSFENTVGKGEIARFEQFLLFAQCFVPFGELSVIFMKLEIVVCKLFQFEKGLDLHHGAVSCLSNWIELIHNNVTT